MRVYCIIVVTFSIFPIKIFFSFIQRKNILKSKCEQLLLCYCLHMFILMEILMFCFFFCFFLRTNLVFTKNPNQVHGIYNGHFLPYFYSNKIYFTNKLDKVTSVIFKQIKHFIIIESSFNHLEKAWSIPCLNNLIN